MATVERYNRLVESGRDEEFGRFGAGRDRQQLPLRRVPQAIRQPPFYAMPLYALTRKSMGGVRIDASSRVLTPRGTDTRPVRRGRGLHREALQRAWTCTRCHNERAPFRTEAHQIDRIAQIDTCIGCHVTRQPD